MSTENTSAAAASTQPRAGDTKPRSKAVQSLKAANTITAGGQMIDKALADPAIVALLTPRGYDAAELQAGQALYEAAQEAFNKRQEAIGSVSEAKKARDGAWDAAREEYVEFRTTVQAKYADAATRRALGASGPVPVDLQKFVTQATAAYQAAQKAPFAEPLGKRSFTAARLQAALAGLKTLTALDNGFAAAGGESGGLVSDRDDAVAKLQAWLREFRTNAALALKRHPAHLATLDL